MATKVASAVSSLRFSMSTGSPSSASVKRVLSVRVLFSWMTFWEAARMFLVER